MLAHRPGPPLERMREALASRVEETSLRQVAREIGMSPTGLQKVLQGADSYSRTRRKIERWYVRETSRYGGELDAEAVATALGLALQDLPPRSRPRALDRLVSELEALYDADDRDPPPWLVELRRSLGTGL